MNISGREINKSRINIDAPEGACDLFLGFFLFFLNFFPQFLQKYLILDAAVMSLPDGRDAFDQTLKWSRARHVWMFGPRGQHKKSRILAV